MYPSRLASVRSACGSLLATSLILGSLLGPRLARAQVQASERNEGWDYLVGAGARTRPLGGALHAEAGWNHLLWGDTGGVKFGYVRPAVWATTAGTISAAEAAVSVFPVSFFGVTAAAGRISRLRATNRDLDCSVIECEGDIGYATLGGDLTLGAGALFFSANLKRRDLYPARKDHPFYEDGEAVVAGKGGDRANVQAYALGLLVGGMGLGPAAVGVSYRRSDYAHGDAFTERTGLFLGHSMSAWRFNYLVGTERTSLYPSSAQVLVQIEWVGRKGLGLN